MTSVSAFPRPPPASSLLAYQWRFLELHCLGRGGHAQHWLNEWPVRESCHFRQSRILYARSCLKQKVRPLPCAAMLFLGGAALAIGRPQSGAINAVQQPDGGSP